MLLAGSRRLGNQPAAPIPWKVMVPPFEAGPALRPPKGPTPPSAITGNELPPTPVAPPDADGPPPLASLRPPPLTGAPAAPVAPPLPVVPGAPADPFDCAPLPLLSDGGLSAQPLEPRSRATKANATRDEIAMAGPDCTGRARRSRHPGVRRGVVVLGDATSAQLTHRPA